ncbi:Holliday junction branch migration protein RuvA [bacterium]|nr:Holliday junction branch migration protein RuvA [bacterium]
MIAGLRGTVVLAEDSGLVHLRCGPAVLELHMPVSQARELRTGEDAALYTHLHFSSKSDQLKLFGFASILARDLFATLITGPGVGPKVALALLELGAEGLVAAVRDGDEKMLITVPGVGPKLAKKIVLELSDKVAKEFAGVAAATARIDGQLAGALREALDAVVALGFPRLKAEQALAQVRSDYDGQDRVVLIRRMLARLSTR